MDVNSSVHEVYAAMKKKEENIIELRNIKKSYDKDVPVIDDFNLEIQKGEFVTFLGPSGCGKTTILRMIGGFEFPTSGEILLNGQDISKLPPNKRPVNTVFQKYALFPYLNIYENIAFGLKIKKLPAKEIQEKVRRVLDIVDLEGFENRKVTTLSGGQQQRVAIARAIVNEPEILLLDEPLGALDYKMRKEMQLELKQMHEELGITFIYVTHDQEEALTMSDKIVVIAHGRIQHAGTPEEIYQKPKNPFVADFIGESNIFNGFMTGEQKVTFCDAEFDCVDEYPVGTKVDAVIRPENVILTEVSEGKIKGEVISSVFKGNYHEITVQSDNYEIVAQSSTALKRGQAAGIAFRPSVIHIMPYDMTKNHYAGTFDEEFRIHLADGVLEPDLSRIYPNSVFSNNVLYSKEGRQIRVGGARVEISFESKDASLSDDPEEGLVQGKIVSIIYKGDHYSYTVRSKNDMDYYVNDEWLWNIGDYVSVVVPEEKMQYRLNGGFV